MIGGFEIANILLHIELLVQFSLKMDFKSENEE